MALTLSQSQINALTQVQSWVYRYLTSIDNSGLPNAYAGIPKPRGGVLGAIEGLQVLTAEGVDRGYIAAYASPQGTAPNPPTDADVEAAGWPTGTAALFNSVVYTCQALNAMLTASGQSGTVMGALLSTRQ